MKGLLILFLTAGAFAAGPPVSNVTFDFIGKGNGRLTFNTGAPSATRAATLTTPITGTQGGGAITLSGAYAAGFRRDQGMLQFATGEFFPYTALGAGDSAQINGRGFYYRQIDPLTTSAGVLQNVVISNNSGVATLNSPYAHSHYTGETVTVSGGPFGSGRVVLVTAVTPNTITFSITGVANGTYTSGISLARRPASAPFPSHSVGETVTFASNNWVFCWAPQGQPFTESNRLDGNLQGYIVPQNKFHIVMLSGLSAGTTYNYKIRAFEDGNEWYSSQGSLNFGIVGCTAPVSANITDMTGTFATAAPSSPAANLPQTTVNLPAPASFGRTYTVNASNCNDSTTGLQALINRDAAQTDALDSVIYVPHGITCIAPPGGYLLLNKAGTGTTVVRTDTADALLPDPQTRIDPSYAPLLPLLLTEGSNGSQCVFCANESAHDYRLQELNIRLDPNADASALVSYVELITLYDLGLPTPAPRTAGQDPSLAFKNIAIDRCYAGGPENNALATQAGIRVANMVNFEVINSYIDKIRTYQEQGPIAIDTCQTCLIENNYLEGGSETLFLNDQGSIFDPVRGTPTDITIRRNVLTHPLAWFSKDPSYPNHTKIAVTSAARVDASTVSLGLQYSHDVGNGALGGGAPAAVNAINVLGASGLLSPLNGNGLGVTRVDSHTLNVTASLAYTVASGDTLQFNSTVTGTGVTGVTWSAALGTISPAGFYTAPTISATRFDVVTATSTADSTKFFSTLVTVNPSTSVSVAPAFPTRMSAGATQQFTAPIPVNWTTVPQIGSISASGVYKAPASVTSLQAVVVIAIDQTNPNNIAAALLMLDPAPAVFRVRAGAVPYSDPAGQLWSPDTAYAVTPGVVAAPIGNAISGTYSPVAYQTERVGAAVTYNFPVPNGAYSVVLRNSENYYSCSLCRIFNVAINGTPVQINEDIYSQVGKFAAFDRTYTATAAGNSGITISFTRGAVDNPTIKGIEVFAGTEPIRVFAAPVVSGPLSLAGQNIFVGYSRPSGEKNLLEIKNGDHVLVERNILLNNWSNAVFNLGGSQGGSAWLGTPRGDQLADAGGLPRNLTEAQTLYRAYSRVRDITYRHNMLSKVGLGLTVSGVDNSGMIAPTARITVEDNLLYDIDAGNYNYETAPMQTGGFYVANGVEDLTWIHNTVWSGDDAKYNWGGLGGAPWLAQLPSGGGLPNDGLFVMNSIFPWGSGPTGTGAGSLGYMVSPLLQGIGSSWQAWQGGSDAAGNAYSFPGLFMIGQHAGDTDNGFTDVFRNTPRKYIRPPYTADASLFSGTHWIGNAEGGVAAVKFRNTAGKDFHLSPGSVLAGAGSDTQDPGAQFSRLDPLLDGVMQGIRTPELRYAVRVESRTSSSLTLEYDAPTATACAALLFDDAGNALPATPVHTPLPAKSLKTSQDSFSGLAGATWYRIKIGCGSDYTLYRAQTM